MMKNFFKFKSLFNKSVSTIKYKRANLKSKIDFNANPYLIDSIFIKEEIIIIRKKHISVIFVWSKLNLYFFLLI